MESLSAAAAFEENWTSLELEFCKDRAYKPTVGWPNQRQIQKAKDEYEARFMSEDGKDSGVPGVLVATKVGPVWKLCESEASKFYLTTSRDLFLISLNASVKGVLRTELCQTLSWCRAEGLDLLVLTGLRITSTFGGAITDPEYMMRPSRAWSPHDNPPHNRVIIDLEYKQRGPVDARRLGFRFLNASHFHRAYVHIQVFPRDHNTGNVAALAVVWHKEPVPPATVAPPPGVAGPGPARHLSPQVWPAVPADLPPPASLLAAAGPIANAALETPEVGVSVFHSAFNFGTGSVSAEALEPYTSPTLPGLLPPIPALPPHLGPCPATTYPPAPPGPFQLRIPAGDVAYLVRDDLGNLVHLPVAGHDLVLDLARMQEVLGYGVDK